MDDIYLDTCTKMKSIQMLGTMIACGFLAISFFVAGISKLINPPRLDEQGKEDPSGNVSYGTGAIFLIVSLIVGVIAWYTYTMRQSDGYLISKCNRAANRAANRRMSSWNMGPIRRW